MSGNYGEKVDPVYLATCFIGVAYSTIYDLLQMKNDGWEYLKDSWNYTDMAFNFIGLVNILFAYTALRDQTTDYAAANTNCVVSMCVVLTMALAKTFFYLRCSWTLAYLVTLII